MIPLMGITNSITVMNHTVLQRQLGWREFYNFEKERTGTIIYKQKCYKEKKCVIYALVWLIPNLPLQLLPSLQVFLVH